MPDSRADVIPSFAAGPSTRTVVEFTIPSRAASRIVHRDQFVRDVKGAVDRAVEFDEIALGSRIRRRSLAQGLHGDGHQPQESPKVIAQPDGDESTHGDGCGPRECASAVLPDEPIAHVNAT